MRRLAGWLQVAMVVSIAPLIFIYVESKTAGMLLCAWIVAFFPVLSSTTLGLNSVDHKLRDLYRIYGANRWLSLSLSLSLIVGEGNLGLFLYF